MDKKVQDLLVSAKSPEDAVRIAAKYGYNTEIRKIGELNEENLEDISGGKTEVQTVKADNCVVVRDRSTGEILCVLPY